MERWYMSILPHLLLNIGSGLLKRWCPLLISNINFSFKRKIGNKLEIGEQLSYHYFFHKASEAAASHYPAFLYPKFCFQRNSERWEQTNESDWKVVTIVCFCRRADYIDLPTYLPTLFEECIGKERKQSKPDLACSSRIGFNWLAFLCNNLCKSSTKRVHKYLHAEWITELCILCQLHSVNR